MANNEVLANLQRAYLAANDSVRFRIRQAWRLAKHGWESGADADETDAEIRAWQPEQPDPLAELTRRVEALEESHAETIENITAGFGRVDQRIRKITHPDHQPAPEQDDPVCANCGHRKSFHDEGWHLPCHEIDDCTCPAFLPAPPAAPLDPVLVKIKELYVVIVPEPTLPALLGKLACELRYEWARIELPERETVTTNEVDAAIRAYGVPS